MRHLAILAIALAVAALLYFALRWRGGWMPRIGLIVLAVAIVLGGVWRLTPQEIVMPDHDNGEDVRPLYAKGRVLPQGPEQVYHLGHSLVERDMPAMLVQLAGHDYALQLGWGTALREHFQGREAINGFAQENATPKYRDAHEALKSGEYGAFVMTEMVSVRDAILYKDSKTYVGKWAAEAVQGNPDIDIFLYETWHDLKAPDHDWLNRLPDDLDGLWTQLLWPAARAAGRPVWLIPAGQVLFALVTEAETGSGIAELRRREDLFRDDIHMNDLGNYLIALTHYAVIYGKTPVGLPHELKLGNGEPAQAPSPELARRMQEVVWQVVTSQPLTGV
ncbi:hypothetical protein [Paracoccus aestuariivivens]|uniref:Uncharacterized protein n=1 Tax=Paracoccus aestuariivivens TaxID=1820333 RepID=A0A6L6J4B6_9RHOB|nr:hypothetical protein [Paracoccus aestuariivivens]MTH76396.1 hypothetical protein [Paracoccus aestuariivivens]